MSDAESRGAPKRIRPSSSPSPCAASISLQSSLEESAYDEAAYDEEDMVDESASEHTSLREPDADRRHPRFMVPYASGLSTMGEIHSFGATLHTQSPAESLASMARQPSSLTSAYPPTWHEYEDQFNYFYNCHFVDQDYYDYLAGNTRPIPGADGGRDTFNYGNIGNNASANSDSDEEPGPSDAASDICTDSADDVVNIDSHMGSVIDMAVSNGDLDSQVSLPTATPPQQP
ncbi:hypothetical protein GGI07_003483 [Coemansia sp. Benny D115]|nr:hypothetical protein GGI07_003483 [Coemansia sp. Benny D115]